MSHVAFLFFATAAFLAGSFTGYGQDAKPALIDKDRAAGKVAGHVLVSGDVKRECSVDITVGETLTLTPAISRAGGIGEWGDASKVTITRRKSDGELEKHTVNLRKIIKSGDPNEDPTLQDGDRIFVPRRRIGF